MSSQETILRSYLSLKTRSLFYRALFPFENNPRNYETKPKNRHSRRLANIPLVETDLLFAFLNQDDSYHETAKNLFNKIREGYNVQISTLSLVELELLYKTNQIEDMLLHHLAILTTLPNLEYLALTSEVVLTATALRQDHNISFFDSHYAATAIKNDRKMISTDQVYKRIPGIIVIDV